MADITGTWIEAFAMVWARQLKEPYKREKRGKRKKRRRG